ncbi:hypothetical protein AYO44_05380 [Planctomycetaceae bacterium SCGC AG-212-F19]|nr:hypothetical protein AYO44_05380 [Planctomycetaceae bacterium SCGC AG-212-F19]
MDRPADSEPTRDQRIAALMDQLRPKVEAALREMVERAVDVPGLLAQSRGRPGEVLPGLQAGHLHQRLRL